MTSDVTCAGSCAGHLPRRRLLSFPAHFVLIGAMNTYPCGHFGGCTHECTCSMRVISRYQKRISSPLLDRIDLHIEVPGWIRPALRRGHG